MYSYNSGIANEVNNAPSNIEQIDGIRWPSSIPVLIILGTEAIKHWAWWEPSHEEQLDLNCGNHALCIIEGHHYPWFTGLSEFTDKIKSFVSSL